jgi:hypothetical protein
MESETSAVSSSSEGESESEESRRRTVYPKKVLEPGKKREPEKTETVYYNVPDEMRAVMLVAGRDYLTSPRPPTAQQSRVRLTKALNRGERI